MQVIVRADDGDQIAIDADDVATEQAVIRLGFANPTFNEASEFEGVTLTTARARDYLRDLVQDLLRGSPDAFGHPSGLHAYLLPCEAVFAHRKEDLPIVDAVEELREQCAENERIRVSTHYGPIRDALGRWNPPAADEAERMVRTRFALFFESLVPQP